MKARSRSKTSPTSARASSRSSQRSSTRASTTRARRPPKSAAAGPETTVTCTEKNPGLRSTTLKALIREALTLLGRPRATVSLVLTGDTTLQRLNRDYLETDRPTDVLSFPLADPDELRDPDRACFLGEIYISVERAREQARAARRPYHAEVAHLTIHGLLHLLGHDHPTPGERRRMKAIEDRLQRRLAVRIGMLPTVGD